jgi:hypothetical protein
MHEEVSPATRAELDELRRRLARAEDRARTHARKVERDLWQIRKSLERLVALLEEERGIARPAAEETFGEFLADHPELTRQPDLIGELDDSLLLAALATAAKEQERVFRGVYAFDVARVVVNGSLHVADAERSHPSHSDVVRVGRALGRLSRAGRVCRVTHPGETPQVWLPDELERALG